MKKTNYELLGKYRNISQKNLRKMFYQIIGHDFDNTIKIGSFYK